MLAAVDHAPGLMVPGIGRATVPVMQESAASTRVPLRSRATRPTIRKNVGSAGFGLHRGQTTTICVWMISVFIALTLGCDRNIEPYQPGEEPSAPDLARIFPGPPAGAESSGAQASGIPDRTALPPSRAEGSAVEATASAPIDGEIDLASALVSAAPRDAVLFVIARPQGVRGGPPLAVLRIPSPQFPLAFSIGPDNVMIPSMRFEGNISLTARLDADGNAMTRGEGDLSSPPEEPLTPGTTGVRLVLSQRG